MRNLKNFVIMSRKNIGPEAFLIQLVSSVVHNRLKNLSTAVKATRHATRILLRGVNQKQIFLHKNGLI